jgi:hypothetical protein
VDGGLCHSNLACKLLDIASALHWHHLDLLQDVIAVIDKLAFLSDGLLITKQK